MHIGLAPCAQCPCSHTCKHACKQRNARLPFGPTLQTITCAQCAKVSFTCLHGQTKGLVWNRGIRGCHAHAGDEGLDDLEIDRMARAMQQQFNPKNAPVSGVQADAGAQVAQVQLCQVFHPHCCAVGWLSLQFIRWSTSSDQSCLKQITYIRYGHMVSWLIWPCF